jgi:DNA-binding NarL/FixJ family response regulator
MTKMTDHELDQHLRRTFRAVAATVEAGTGGGEPIRVLVVDDHALFRRGLEMVLGQESDIEVVGEAGDGAEAVTMAGALRPDVVLMDVRMPVMDGIEATRRIVGSGSAARILVLTTFDLDEYVFEALRTGASGFLVKDTEPVELLRAVRVVARGGALLSPSVTLKLIAEVVARRGRRDHLPSLDGLTEREREVMALVANGLSNDEIAEQLMMSPATAKTHVSRAMLKLGARDRAQLVVFAYEAGLVQPGAQR